jgi:serine acetyltransferase
MKVGANAVVTKSFPEGHVTLVGIPARPAHAPASGNHINAHHE